MSNFFKSIFNAGMACAVAAMTVMPMASCSSDDEGGGGGGNDDYSGAVVENSNFGTPQYESSATRYVADSQSATVQQIELTASGQYMISDRSLTGMAKHHSAKAETKKSKLARMATRAYDVYSSIAYGTYIKIGDNKYKLDGYGVIEIVPDANGNAYTIKVTRDNGTTENIEAKKTANTASGAMSDMLCRSWKIVKFRMFAKENSRYIFDITATSIRELYVKLNDFASKNDPEYDPSDWEYDETEPLPESITFTKTGRYVVFYSTSELAISTWKWSNENTGLLRYSWNPDRFEDEYAAGDVSVRFKDNQLQLTESEKEYDEEDNTTYEEGVTYTCNEIK